MTVEINLPAQLGHKPELDLQTMVFLAQSADDAFERCVTLALQKTRATTVVISLYCAEFDELVVVAAAGQRAVAALGRRLPRGQGLGWHVLSTSAPYLVENALNNGQAHFVAGRPRPGMYLGVPLLAPDGQMLGVLSADTTDSDEILGAADARFLLLLGQAAGVAYSRWKALEDAQRSARQYQQLAHLSAQLETLAQPDDIAREALKMLLALSEFDIGATMTLDEHGLARLGLIQGDEDMTDVQDMTDVIVAALKNMHVPRGLLAEIIESNRSVAVSSYCAPPESPPQWMRVRSILAAPLRSGQRIVGFIGLLKLDTPRVIPAELVALLDMVAARVDRAQERVGNFEQMRQMREAALRSVGRVLEGRDGETFGHTDRVTAMAVRLGQALGLADEALQHLRWGAYLHDIGKVTISDDILRKPGPLTEQERSLMQKHVIVGDHMLREEILVPREVRAIVRSHHERWDGAGYPDGLAAEKIPLLARIFSVVDVYDALISKRPYKPAWTHAQALEELRRGAGSQFDPHALACFETLFSHDGGDHDG
ncbi:HD domain-containing phosphohydrolase [Deinococcus arenicola]|uniref:HD domain-containing protein n=1 Tax=Deinococcus arenicola TaxID=2994950 RepID=A0ABU4DP21_9DEIO|nr:HD domain-containing phosphohydrolase [Deinococcus sp. ZS9-10]MDV6373444.1 HD domain-containing protein [Deinococcus sp. ZS9-10]